MARQQPKRAEADTAAEPKRGRGRPRKVVRTNTNINPEAVAACYTEYSSMRGDVARLGQKIAAMFTRYEKSDGIDSKAIKSNYALSEKDPETAAAQLRRNNEYARILGIISFDSSGQGDFSAGLDVSPQPVPTLAPATAARVQAARAHADGYNTGKAGGTLEHNTNIIGTEAHVRWIEGYHDGHADRLLKNPDMANVKQASSRRARRDPPPADAAEAMH
jgi:ribosome modulation factor